MTNAAHHIVAAQSRLLLRLLLAAGLVSVAAITAAAQQLQVRAVHGLALGTMLRSAESSVVYYSNNAAVFEVTGAKGHVVQFMLTATYLAQPDGPAGRSSMILKVLPTHCAYSIDNGMSWTPFNAGAIWQEVRLPSKGGGGATLMVRAGGRALAAVDQHHGEYAGATTLTAIYK